MLRVRRKCLSLQRARSRPALMPPGLSPHIMGDGGSLKPLDLQQPQQRRELALPGRGDASWGSNPLEAESWRRCQPQAAPSWGSPASSSTHPHPNSSKLSL